MEANHFLDEGCPPLTGCYTGFKYRARPRRHIRFMYGRVKPPTPRNYCKSSWSAIFLVHAGGIHKRGAFVWSERAGGAPQDFALSIDEEHDDLLVIGNGDVLKEFPAVDPDGDDPAEGLGVALIAAHRGGLPPAEDGVFLLGDGELVVAKLEVKVLEGLGGGHPGIDVILLFGAEGEQEQIDLALEFAGQRDFFLVEAVRGDRREGGRLGLLRAEGNRQTTHESEKQRWAQELQSEGPTFDREKAWRHSITGEIGLDERRGRRRTM